MCSCHHDGRLTDRPTVSESSALHLPGHLRQSHCFRGGHLHGLWTADCCWFVIILEDFFSRTSFSSPGHTERYQTHEGNGMVEYTLEVKYDTQVHGVEMIWDCIYLIHIVY